MTSYQLWYPKGNPQLSYFAVLRPSWNLIVVKPSRLWPRRSRSAAKRSQPSVTNIKRAVSKLSKMPCVQVAPLSLRASNAPRLQLWPAARHLKGMPGGHCACWPIKQLNSATVSGCRTPQPERYSKKRTPAAPQEDLVHRGDGFQIYRTDGADSEALRAAP